MAKKRKPLTNKKGEVRELTVADMEAMRPIKDVDPALAAMLQELQAAKAAGELETVTRADGFVEMRRKRGAPKLPETSKRQVLSVRVAPAIAKAIKAHGRGVNAKIEKVLRDAIEEGRL